MDSSAVLAAIREWQLLLRAVEGISRSYEDEVLAVMGSKPIKIITGFRRSGKSFLVQRIASRLLRQKAVAESNILYLNFEELAFSEIASAADLDAVFRLFKSDIATAGKKLVILDEIQRVTGWDRFVRTVYEKYRDVELVITGSNSELLSAELGSNLAGRFIEYSILPFDFDEFLRLRGLVVKNRTQLGLERDRVESLFREYLAFGGLPELLTIGAEKARLTYLEGILSKVILDDVIKRFSIRQATVIEQLMRYLLANAGYLTVNRRLAEFLKNEGHDVKPETVAMYIDCILRTFAFCAVEKLDSKQSRAFSTRKKYYAVDTGLLALARSPTPNRGVQLEHAVQLALRRRGVEVFFGALPNGKEIDFITRDRSGQYAKYQVTTALSAENRSRELAPFKTSGRLEKGANYLLCGEGEEETVRLEGVAVERKNIIPWLLGL